MDEDAKALRAEADFMRSKLEETRKALKGQSVVIPYDNGGGQVGIRANPAFAEYERLGRAYHATLRALAEIDGGRKQGKAGSLDEVRKRAKIIRCVA